MEHVPFGKFGFLHRSAVDWMRKHVGWFVAVVLVVAGLIAWSIRHGVQGSVKDYRLVETTFKEWRGGKSQELVKLQKILKLHPELHAKYDGRIAQKLLLSSEQGLAASFSKAVLKRMSDISPFHAQFSQCSLLIGENRLEEAAKESMALKEILAQQGKNSTLLYAYTLLRIAFLEGALEHKDKEQLAWQAFKECAAQHGHAPLLHNFHLNTTTLPDYIHHRETQRH